MALFAKKTPAPQAELDQMRNRRADIARDLAAEEATVADRTKAAATLFLNEADADAVAMAEADVRAAEIRVQTRRNALSALNQQIEKKSAEIAAAADKKLREQTCAELEAVSEEISEAALAYIDGARRFAQATAKITPTVWEATPMSQLAEALTNEIAEGSALVANLIREHQRAVIEKRAPAALMAPEVTAARPAAPPPPQMVRVYVLDKGVKWKSSANPAMTEFRPMTYSAIDLPADLAGQAVASGAALLITDKRVAALASTHSPKRMTEASCRWIDGSTDSPAEPDTLDTDPNRVLRVPGHSPRIRAVGV